MSGTEVGRYKSQHLRWYARRTAVEPEAAPTIVFARERLSDMAISVHLKVYRCHVSGVATNSGGREAGLLLDLLCAFVRVDF